MEIARPVQPVKKNIKLNVYLRKLAKEFLNNDKRRSDKTGAI
jgi:hypothetical protein